MKLHTFRLKPGQDLRIGIERYAKSKNISAGFVLTCVGAVKSARLRLAGAKPENQPERIIQEACEIVSLEGTIAKSGAHFHISLSDDKGNVIGGHLKEATVYPTAEIVLGEDETSVFNREQDPETGFDELVIKPANH